MQTDRPNQSSRWSPQARESKAGLPAQPEWWRVTLSSIGDGVIATDASGQVTFMNSVAESLTGITLERAAGKPLHDVFRIVNEHTGAAVPDPVERVLREGGVIGLASNTMLCRPDGTRVPIDDSGAPIHGDNGSLLGAVLVFRDITERRHSDRELNHRAQALATLNECAIALSSELNVDRLVQLVTDAATRLSGAKFGAFFYNVINDSGEAYMLYTLSGAPREAFSKFPMPRKTAVFGPTFSGAGIVRSDDISKDPRYGRNAPYHGMPAGHLPVRSYLAVPVVSRSGEVIGGLFFGHPEPGVFSESIEHMIASLASHAAVAIDNARLLEAANRELEVRKQAEAALVHQSQVTRTITENATAALFMLDQRGYCTFMNPAAERMTGFTFEEIRARPLHEMIHHHRPDGRPYPIAECPIDRALPEHLQVRGHEDVFIRKDGTFFPVMCSVSPILEQGRPVASVVEVTDITEAKRASEELLRHRQHLEMLVQARTAELDQTHERLRFSERMASIGTLAAGIGHDMGNLLLPLRSRLEALQRSSEGSANVEHFRAIEQSADYLQALARGLRLLALDPDDPHASGSQTVVPDWWKSVHSLLRSVLGRQVSFSFRFDDNLPPLRIAPHRLTQAVLNLLSNANQALEQRPEAHVALSVMRNTRPDTIYLSIADNGLGMSAEVRRRALEPFFTTRHRSISTGLGLSMVHGIVTSVGGAIRIESEPGKGTTVTLAIPSVNGRASEEAARQLRALVSIADLRRRMFLASMLELVDYTVEMGDQPRDDTVLWVLESGAHDSQAIQDFLARSPVNHVLLMGMPPPDLSDLPRLNVVENPQAAGALREAIHTIISSQQSAIST